MQLFQVEIFSDRSRSKTKSDADQLVINLVLMQPLFLFIPCFTRNEVEKAANTWYDLRQRCKANYEGFFSVHLAVASSVVPRVDYLESRWL